MSAVWAQIAPSPSRQIPSGPRPSAQTRRPERLPSSATSKAVRRPATDSATTSVAPSGVTTIPFGKSMPSATRREVPSGATRSIQPGSGKPAAEKVPSKPSTQTWPRGPTTTSLAPDSRRVTTRAVGLAARDRPARGEQAPVGQPRDRPAHPVRPVRHHLGVPVQVDGHDLAGAPVGEPQAVVVPAGGLDHGAPGEQRAGRRQDVHGRQLFPIDSGPGVVSPDCPTSRRVIVGGTSGLVGTQRSRLAMSVRGRPGR